MEQNTYPVGVVTEDVKERIKRHFSETSDWPEPFKPAPAGEALPIKVIRKIDFQIGLRDAQTNELACTIAFHVRRQNIEVASLTIRADYQNKGHGKQIGAFLLDEFKGLGVPRVLANASQTGSYFLNRLGFNARTRPVHLLSTARRTLKSLSTRQRGIVSKLIIDAPFTRERFWAAADLKVKLPNGSKLGPALFQNTSWDGAFEIDDPASVQRLADYTAYPLRHLKA